MYCLSILIKDKFSNFLIQQPTFYETLKQTPFFNTDRVRAERQKKELRLWHNANKRKLTDKRKCEVYWKENAPIPPIKNPCKSYV